MVSENQWDERDHGHMNTHKQDYENGSQIDHFYNQIISKW